MSRVKVTVTACDNELYILAIQPRGSYELIHMKSGFDNPVSDLLTVNSVVPPGDYTLAIIGINWASSQNISVTVDIDGTDTVYNAPPSTAVGANWTVAIPISLRD